MQIVLMVSLGPTSKKLVKTAMKIQPEEGLKFVATMSGSPSTTLIGGIMPLSQKQGL